MFLSRPRIPRALSAFDRASKQWTAIPLRDPHNPVTQTPSPRPAVAHVVGRQTLSLITWNIEASKPKSGERAERILEHVLNGPKFPDIVFLQEVASRAREALLNHPAVRSGFLTTDAEDNTSFTGVPFATMTLLSRKRFCSPLLANEECEGEGECEGESKGSPKLMLDSVFRTEFPSRYKRDALCVNIAAPSAPGAVMRLLNVHLDSLHAQFRRTLQMQVLAGLLREPGCSGGVIAGDFNAIHPDDYTLVDKNGLVDAWVALHGPAPGRGATWGFGVDLDHGRKPGRLDKVVMLGVQPDEIDVLPPGILDASMPWTWSDHCGLRCAFTI